MFYSNLGRGKSITIKLVGGLGNQLFGYFAGLALARQHHVPLRLDVTDIRSIRNTHRVTLESFELEGDFFTRRQYPLVSRIFEKTNKVFSRILKSKNYFSEKVGFDSQLFNLPPGTSLHGYFQSYIYYQYCYPNNFQANIKNPSAWYKNKLDEIVDKNVLAIHVRRGDYVELENLYGLLSFDYYSKAFIEIKKYFYPDEIWVFSDDKVKAADLLSKLEHERVFIIESGGLINPAEHLSLMSKARGLIIANSTFSWWSAALSSNSAVICCPNKWYKGMEDPELLIPPNWIQIPSEWLS